MSRQHDQPLGRMKVSNGTKAALWRGLHPECRGALALIVAPLAALSDCALLRIRSLSSGGTTLRRKVLGALRKCGTHAERLS